MPASRAVALSTESVHVCPQPQWTKVSNISVQVSVVQRPDLTIDISDAHILTQHQSDPSVAPHPGWQTEVHRARPHPQANPIPTAQLPWGLHEAGGQALPPFLLGLMPGSPLLGVEVVWGPTHLLRMSCSLSIPGAWLGVCPLA